MDQRPRRPSPALVVAVVALFVALAGVAYALEANSVRSKHIVDGQVKNPDLRGNAVTGAKLGDDAVTATKLGDGAVTEAKLADGAVAPAKVGVVPAVRAQSPSESFNNDQVLNNASVAEPLMFDEEAYDTASMHTGGTYDAEQSKFFAPRAGIYEVSAGLIFSDPGSNYGTERQIYLIKNGTTYIASAQVPPRTAGATILNVSGAASFAQDDYVQAFVTHDAGSNLVTPQSQFGSLGDGRHFLSMTWLGPSS